ncbi:MAG TPA: phosphate-starvation-inducible PsiE family protein [Candidatus Sulfotelmatobacter sp.]|nr:phosphate-starvation-inducible PsiE family protein [Candidatus Sulfotelmatobacter sp.]
MNAAADKNARAPEWLRSDMDTNQNRSAVARTWISRAFTVLEDVVYVGLGLLLGASAVVLLGSGIFEFVQSLATGTFATHAVSLLDRILLILLVVELLYTVQVSFREHALVPEPFLLVGLIAAIRRVLVLTAEFGHGHEQTEEMYKHFFIELVILTGLILAVTISLVLVRRRSQTGAERL